MFSSIVRSIRSLVISASVVLFGAALLGQTSQVVVPNRVVSVINENSRVPLHGYVHPLASALNDRGAAPDSMPLTRMHLVLKRSPDQEAALQQFISDAHTPGSANYHKWLTPDQFGQKFGPSDQDIATVQSWLASHGFEVAGVKPGKQVIEFTGSVAQLREAFHAEIHKYQANGDMHYAAANEPDIPAALSPVVGGFVSLNNFHLKSHARLLGKASFDPKTGTAKPEWTVNGGEGYPTIGGVNFAMTPGDFGVQYDLPNASLNSKYTGTTYDGSGQTIAIINESNINIDLVNQFRTLFGLPTNPPNVIIDGNDPGVDGINNPDGLNYASGEAYLDVEWSGAVAPKATIDLVIAADTALESGLYLAAENAVYSNLAPVISASFGDCESDLGSTNQFIEQSLWEQAAAQGITVTVSTGDNGSAGCDNPDSEEYAVNGAAISGFASTPYNVAVGGTDFYYSNYQTLTLANLATYWSTTGSNTPGVSMLTTIPEQPWNNSQYGLNASNYLNTYGITTIGAGSGGASSAAVCAAGYSSSTGACTGTTTGYAKPAWQTGTGVPADKVRDIPDVSLFAADGPNYSYYAVCYQDGDCQPNSSGPVQVYGVGGTSASAPAFAGIMALVNQKYGRQGQADFVLYPLKTQFGAAFHDVTVGSNSVPCEPGSLNCIAVSNPVTFNGITEGQIGTGTTPDYNATAGYDLATGLGSVDASVLLADWGNVTFKSTTTTLTPSSTSFAHGTAITVNGSVTGSPTPTGDVGLMTDSTTPSQQGQSLFTLSNGSFSSSNVNYLPGGTYNVWGHYGGDSSNAPSDSAKTQITVSPEASTVYFNILNTGTTSSGSVAISSGTTAVPYGTQALLAAQIFGTSYYNNCFTTQSTSAACSFYTTPTGSVVFADNGTTINTATLNTEGDAEFNGPFYVGAHSVTASYAGDASYQKSSASAITFTIVKDTPDIYAGASNQCASCTGTSFTGGQTTYFDVLVENSANDSTESNYGVAAATRVLAPTGSITLTGPSSIVSGGSQTLTLSAGVDPSSGQPVGIGVLTIPSGAAAGTYTLNFSYAGDSNYNSVSGSGSIGITAAPSLQASSVTASMTGSISPTTSITVTGTVTGQSGHPAPTGVIYAFPSGEGTTAQFALTPGTGDASTFTGLLTSQNLFEGSNIVTLQYSGDTTYNGSAVTLNSGNAISNPLSDFSLTAASSIVPVPASSSATTTVYVTPTNNYAGTVNLACSVIGSPTGVTCSLSQSSASLTSSATAGLDLRSAPRNHQSGRHSLYLTGEGAVFACVLLLTIPAKRRAFRNMLGVLLFACIIGFGVGCGGGSSSSGGGGGGVGGGGGGGTGVSPTNTSVAVTLTVTASGSATAGNYAVSVTGSAGSQIHTLGVMAAVQ
ncbi:MAG TPA: protease pro-enzyme activation domain-containing protein [Acidobacteriaceae bacterium]|nr:protease pro-enzyme activation domain-containing protein [Acidobacteriaceae bacterium]